MPPRIKVWVGSESDRRLLQTMLDRERRGQHNTQGRARTENTFVDNVDHQSPQHYIAHVPVGGIPALTAESAGTSTAGTAIGPAGDVPGSALCDVYKIVNRTLRSAGFSKRVYNITEGDISQGWVTVSRDSFGTWIANVGGSTTMLVRISESIPGTGTLGTGTVYGDPVAVYRDSHPLGLEAYALDENHDDTESPFTIYADELVNVHYTDAIVRVTSFGGKWQIVTTGENNWEDGFTLDAIDVDTSVGTAPETQGRVQLFSEGPTVYAGTSFPIGQYIFCQVRFDSQAQKFRIGDQACSSAGGVVGT